MKHSLLAKAGQTDKQTYLKQDNKHLLEVARCVPNDVSLQVSLVC